MKNAFLLSFAFFLCNLGYAQIPNYVSTNNLVAWVPFDGSLSDLSINANAVNGNAYTFTTNRNGQVNKACNFAGGATYAQLQNIPINTNGDYSFNFWIKVNNFSNYPTNYIALDIHPSSTNCVGYPQYGMINDTLYSAECANAYTRMSLGHKSVFINNWKMVTQVVKTDSTFLYIDGILLKKYPYTWGFSTTTDFIIANSNTTNFTEGVNATYDDLGIWSRAITPCEIRKLFHAQNSYIATQPINQTLYLGSSATFTITSTIGTSATYQWQINNSSGFINLTNSGQYSGTNTNALTISNLTSANYTSTFRCLVTDCNSDTSNVVKLDAPEALPIVNAFNNTIEQNIPNPLQHSTTINYTINNFKTNAVIVLYDMTGKAIRTENIFQTGKNSLEIKNLSAGIYFYSLVIDNAKIDTKKMVVLE